MKKVFKFATKFVNCGNVKFTSFHPAQCSSSNNFIHNLRRMNQFSHYSSFSVKGFTKFRVIRYYSVEKSSKESKKDGGKKKIKIVLIILLVFVIAIGSLVSKFYINFKKEKRIIRMSLDAPEPPSEMTYQEIYNLLIGSPDKYEQRHFLYRGFRTTCFYARVCIRVIELLLRFTPLLMAYPILVRFSPFEFSVDLWYKWLLRCFRRSGPVFIKLGQWIGTRKDLFDDKLCDTMKELHSCGDHHTFRKTEKIIKSALHIDDLDEAFAHFQPKPVGTGAIAQVYDTRMKVEFLRKRGYKDIKPDKKKITNLSPLILDEEMLNDTIRVAVKVRHPGIFDVMISDLSILRIIFNFLNCFKDYKWLELDRKLLRFSGHLISQMDLTNEAKNLEVFRKNFAKMPGVIFPEPYSKLTNEKVLIESYEEGTPVNDIIQKKDMYSSKIRKSVARYGIIVFLKMLITDNFLHGDLHPGNMFVRLCVDEKTRKIRPALVVLDTGLVVQLDKPTRYKFYDILGGMARRDGDYCARRLIRGTKEYQKYIDKETNKLDFNLMKDENDRRRIIDFVEAMKVMVCDVVDSPLGESRVAPVFSEVLGLVRVNRITLDNDIVNIVIGMIVSEGLARELFVRVKFLAIAKQVLIMSHEARKDFYMNRFYHLTDSAESKDS